MAKEQAVSQAEAEFLNKLIDATRRGNLVWKESESKHDGMSIVNFSAMHNLIHLSLESANANPVLVVTGAVGFKIAGGFVLSGLLSEIESAISKNKIGLIQTVLPMLP